MACRAIHLLKIAGPRDESEMVVSTVSGDCAIYQQLQPGFEFSAWRAATKVQDTAIFAFCVQDDHTLLMLWAQVRNLWVNFRTSSVQCVFNSMENLLGQHIQTPLAAADMTELALVRTSMEPTWPDPPPIMFQIPHDMDGQFVDDVFRSFEIDGKRVLRFVTAHMVNAIQMKVRLVANVNHSSSETGRGESDQETQIAHEYEVEGRVVEWSWHQGYMLVKSGQCL